MFTITDGQYADLVTRKRFADNLLIQFKQNNIDEGINALQAMWIHERMRAWSYTFMGNSFTVDLMNMSVSGDIETACLALQYGTADDMSHPKHWFTQDRLNFIINEMKQFLGWP
jgi:hypothetical protein